MCKIYDTRKYGDTVFIDFQDEEREFGGVRKMDINDYEYAAGFKNASFLVSVAKTTRHRDINASYCAESFRDPAIEYSVPYWR